jgi:hypothetical protein
MNTQVRKLAAGGLVALALASTIVTSSTPASAQYYHRYHHGRGFGGPIGLGILGGLAAGMIAGAVAAPHYAPPPPYPYAPDPQCYVAQQPVYDQWGQFAGYGPAEVCD